MDHRTFNQAAANFLAHGGMQYRSIQSSESVNRISSGGWFTASGETDDVRRAADRFGDIQNGLTFLGYNGGRPTKLQKIDTGRYSTDAHGIPPQLLGSNDFVRDTIDCSVVEGKSFYTDSLLPWSSSGNINAMWTEVRMDSRVVTQVPEQGVSRLLQFDKRERSGKSVRRGLAIRIERDFAVTQEGQSAFLLSLKGLSRAIRNTVNMEVLNVLLRCEKYTENQLYIGTDQSMYAAADAALREEIANYCRFQRQPNALQMFITDSKIIMQRQGVTMDTLVMAPGVLSYLTFRPEYQGEFEKQEQTDVPLQQMGCKIFEADYIPLRDGLNGEDQLECPLMRYSSVGEAYFVGSSSTTSDAQVQIYDESQDRWSNTDTNFYNVYSQQHSETAYKNLLAFCNKKPTGGTKYDCLWEQLMDENPPDDKFMRQRPDPLIVRNHFSFLTKERCFGRVGFWLQLSPLQFPSLAKHILKTIVKKVKNNGETLRVLESTQKDVLADNSIFAKPEFHRDIHNTQYLKIMNSICCDAFPNNLAFTSTDGYKRLTPQLARQAFAVYVTFLVIREQKQLVLQKLMSAQASMMAFVYSHFIHSFVVSSAVEGDGLNGIKLDGVDREFMNAIPIFGPSNIKIDLGAKITKSKAFDKSGNPKALLMDQFEESEQNQLQFEFLKFKKVIARPRITHRTGSMIAMKGGVETGSTMFGHNNFEITEDSKSGCYYGNSTFYVGAVVSKERNVRVVHDAFAAGYIEGNDMTLLRVEEHIGQSAPLYLTGSCLYMLLPEKSYVLDSNNKFRVPVDVTGVYSSDTNFVSYDHCKHPRKKSVHLPCGPLNYVNLCGHETIGARELYVGMTSQVTLDSGDLKTVEYTSERDLHWTAENTALKQENSLLFNGTYCNAATRQVEYGNGHWGRCVGPGFAALRAGQMGKMDNRRPEISPFGDFDVSIHH